MYLLLATILFCPACNNGNGNKESVADVDVTKPGIERWTTGRIAMDSSVNKALLARFYHLHPLRWDTAMSFLLDADLAGMDTGRYNLLGNDVYATISESRGRQADTSFFESHRNYADIQYVIKGRELIQLTDTSRVKTVTPYVPDKDIAFYSAGDYANLTASPKSYFIFFPNDVHKPSLALNDSLIRKLVIKVRLN